MSDDHNLVEVKDAIRSITVSEAMVRTLHKEATRQNKNAVLIIEFPGYTVRAEITRRTG